MNENPFDAILAALPRNETKLSRVKREHGIETQRYDDAHSSRRWCARFLHDDESAPAFGENELDAVFALCRAHQIPVVL